MSEQPNHTYGIWEVWCGEFPEPNATPEEIKEEHDFLGIFRGHVDDIAFGMTAVRSSEWNAYMFRRADPGVEFQDVSSLPNPREDVCLVDIELDDGTCVSWKPQNIPKYFKHRPVTADRASHTASIRISQLDSPYGKVHAERKARMEAILAKLTEEEREYLYSRGLTTHTY